jgi:hypothetical protein
MFPEIYYVLILFEKTHKINKLALYVVFSMNVSFAARRTRLCFGLEFDNV